MKTEIKQHPILFSTPMVQAILEGRKTMTRRIVKANLDDRGLRFTNRWEDWHGSEVKCPHGSSGDIMWVREEHYKYGHWEEVEGTYTPTGKQKWRFVAEADEVRYSDSPPAEFRGGMHNADPGTSMWYKRLARFMPKEACRLFLKITNIQVERLQDISEENAVEEGVEQLGNGWTDYVKVSRNEYASAKDSFYSLWMSLNGPESWRENPWVWVVSFERIDKPE